MSWWNPITWINFTRGTMQSISNVQAHSLGAEARSNISSFRESFMQGWNSEDSKPTIFGPLSIVVILLIILYLFRR